MNPKTLFQLLEQVRAGTITPEGAAGRLRDLPFEDLGHTRLDHHRALRNGLPEMIYGQGKSAEQLVEIARNIAGREQPFLATRLDGEKAAGLLAAIPDAVHYPDARIVARPSRNRTAPAGGVAVVCAGTSDIPVAEEAAVSGELFGDRVHRAYDVGIAGLHRLLVELPALRKVNAIIAVAGMEGALPSVVAGLVEVPVIAVPTSVGYGTSLGGLTALFAMLNSCAAGLSVVNIDNGFGAACQAHQINRLAVRP